ncbi:MAG: glycosyl hydrolase family 65 protein, partial [Archangium sp.]
LKFSLRYRRNLVEVDITQDKLVLNSRWRSPEPLRFALRGAHYELLPCETREFPIARPPVTPEAAVTDSAGP